MFGGDKDRITIAGESAGSGIVSTFVLSPLTRGLFKRAIMESGALYLSKVSVITTEGGLEVTNNLIKKLRCDRTPDWLGCLRKIDPFIIQSAYPIQQVPPSSFPIIGTEFIPQTAQDAFPLNNFNNGKPRDC